MAGDALRAEAAFRALQAAGHRPRDYGYCGLIAAHSLAGDVPAALRVRQRMRATGGHEPGLLAGLLWALAQGWARVGRGASRLC
jgi:pentatricopeptide repeat protein